MTTHTLTGGVEDRKGIRTNRQWNRILPGNKSSFLVGLLFCVISISIVGCADDSGTNPVPSPSLFEYSVDQNGGQIEYRSTVENITVTLNIPPDAINGDTVITIDHAKRFSNITGLVTGAVFEFGPDNLVFNTPVELTISYTDAMVADFQGANLRIHKQDGNNWIPLLGSVDELNKTVTASLDSFSTYGLKIIPSPGTGGGTGGDTGGDTGGGTGGDTGGGTGGDTGGGTGGGTGGDTGGSGGDSWASIQADILQPNCVLCHNNANPSAGLSWEADQYDTIVTNGYMSTEITTMREIEPGSSATSYMIWKLNGKGPNDEAIIGVRMPATGIFLDQAVVDRIAAWIDAGAPETSTGGGTGGGDTGGGTGGGDTGGGGTGGGDTGGGDTGGGTDPGPDPSSIIPTWYGVQANIFARFCTMCHSGANPPVGLSWEVDQYDAIVTNQHMSTEITTMPEVKPGDPNGSYMYWKITNNPGIVGSFMPATGQMLDQALIDVIEQWILDGAPLGDPTDADSGGTTEPEFPVGSWMYVWTETLQVCTICHSLTPSSPRCGVDFDCPPKDVVLTADNYNGVVDGDEVLPGSLDGSKLWRRVTDPDPDKRMPFEMPALTQSQLDIIESWILDGAPFCPTGATCP